jgi:hypothetical protein
MADGSRRTAAALQQDARLHAQAREEARRVYGDWPTVATDSVKLAADLRNVRAWKDAVEIIASRYEAAAMLERDPTPGNKLEENQRRNILQVLHDTMSPDARTACFDKTSVILTLQSVEACRPSTDAEIRDLVKSLAGLDAAGDPEGYVATHRSVTARIRELDPTHYNGLYPQALGRLLDGTEGIDELRYLRLAHENREGATMKTLYEVGRSIEKLLETSVSSAQTASTSSATKPRCHKHLRFSNHDWDHCDQNPDTKDPSGRDMRRQKLLQRKKTQQAKRQEVIAKAAVEAVLALQTQAGTSPTRNYREATVTILAISTARSMRQSRASSAT